MDRQIKIAPRIPGSLCHPSFLFIVLVAVGCSGDAARGAVAFTTWGEALIEEGIPRERFADGWSVRFTRFLIGITDVTVSDGALTAANTRDLPRVFDLTEPGIKPVVTIADLPARAYPRVAFTIAPITGPALGADDVRARLVQRGAAVHVEGAAEKDGATKTFTWSFTDRTTYDRCRGDKDGRTLDGVVVTAGGVDTAQLTIHGDHLFYDSLEGDSALRFEALARADANNDGDVTLEELAAVHLVDVPGALGPYTTGGRDVTTLRAFVTALARTVAHFRGEGECVPR